MRTHDEHTEQQLHCQLHALPTPPPFNCFPDAFFFFSQTHVIVFFVFRTIPTTLTTRSLVPRQTSSTPQSTLPAAALGSAYPSSEDYTRQLPNLLETMDEMEDDVST